MDTTWGKLWAVGVDFHVERHPEAAFWGKDPLGTLHTREGGKNPT